MLAGPAPKEGTLAGYVQRDESQDREGSAVLRPMPEKETLAGLVQQNEENRTEEGNESEMGGDEFSWYYNSLQSGKSGANS